VYLVTAFVPSLTAYLDNSSTRDGKRSKLREFVVVSQTRSFRSNTLKNVIDEGIHDDHALTGDSSVWMDLLQDLEDVDGIRFLPLLAVLLSVF
jgi:hypothetical protein